MNVFPASFPSLPVNHVMSDTARRRFILHGHQRPRLTGPPSTQTGISRGRVAENPSGPLPFAGDRSSYHDVRRSRAGAAGAPARPPIGIPTSRLQQSGAGYDGRRRGGNSGVTATGSIGKSSSRESSRLRQPSQGPDGTRKSSSYASYLGNARKRPRPDYSGYEETNKLTAMRPYKDISISAFLGSGSQTAPSGPPTGKPQLNSGVNKMARGRSYLFERSQNPPVTAQTVAPAVSVAQQTGSAETQTPAHPAKGIEAKYVGRSRSSVVRGPVSGSARVSKPTQTPKRLYGFRGFEHPPLRAGEEPTKEDSGQRGYPALLAKYSFSQRETRKQEGVQRDSSSTTLGPFTPGSKETPLQALGSINERNPDQRTFNPDRISRPRGFDAPTPEGAKTLIHKSDKSVRSQPGFQGFFLGNSQIWRPEKSGTNRWHNGSGAGSSDVSSTTGELRRKDPGNVNGSTGAEAGFTPDRKIFTFLRFHLNQTHQDFKEQNLAAAVASYGMSPADLGSTGNRTGPGSEPGPQSGSRRSELRDATGVTVPRPARPESVTYADVLGNISFSSR